MKRRLLLALLAAVALCCAEPVDLDVVHRIKAEAFTRSRVMDHLFYLSDVNGPRLTNSPAYRDAANWIRARLGEYGIPNVIFEEWGPFGPGWECTHFAAHLRAPEYAPLIGFPLGWSPGTNGRLRGAPLLLTIHSEADLNAWRGKLRGRIVMLEGPRELAADGAPPARRLTPGELSDLTRAAEPAAPPLVSTPAPPDTAAALRARINAFLVEEGVGLLLTAGQRGDYGTIMAKGAPSRTGLPPLPPPIVAIAAEHYNRIARLLLKHIPVEVEFDIRVRFLPEPVRAFNVVAEIPGTTRRDEIVLLGAHLDSWNSGTGATDNATGVAVLLEAARILKALGIPLERTVRFGFWAAEEHGLLGSKAYLDAHRAELPRLSCYFNDDAGAGRVRGIYLQGHDALAPLFADWLRPFNDLGASTISPRSIHGSDHDAFDAAGVPAFQFLQDPLDYFTRSHHSNMDLYDRVPAGDLMQRAAILASFAYHAARRPAPLARN
jgi:hypothetical protein